MFSMDAAEFFKQFAIVTDIDLTAFAGRAAESCAVDAGGSAQGIDAEPTVISEAGQMQMVRIVICFEQSVTFEGVLILDRLFQFMICSVHRLIQAYETYR